MARIVFDLDGTLIDSHPDIHALANRILAPLDLPPLTRAESRSFIGNGASVFVERMRAARSIPETEHARLLSEFLSGYADAHGLTTLYPGVAQALETLARAGHRLGLCTNKPLHPARQVLAHLGIGDRFGILIGGDSLPVRKPDPAPLRAALAGLGEGPAVFVGDSEVDAETAARATVPFLLFTRGYRTTPCTGLTHHAAFDDHAELPVLVEMLCSNN